MPLEGMAWLRVRPEGEWGCPIASWLGVGGGGGVFLETGVGEKQQGLCMNQRLGLTACHIACSH